MACDLQSLPHHGIQTLSPYIPGKSIDELAKEQGLTNIIKLASNENPLGCSLQVKEIMAKLSSQYIATYPDHMNHPLRQKLAGKLRVDKAMITLANGSDALFRLILMSFALHCDKEIMVHDYSFIPYRIYAQSLGIPYTSVPVNADWEVEVERFISACHEKTAIIFIANPNNPTGTYIPIVQIKKLLNNIPDSTIVVIDEAYHEYNNLEEQASTKSLLDAFPNLIMTRTFSKAYGLAGLRIGYAVSHPDIASILVRAMEPFAINQAGLAGAYTALDDAAFLAETIKTNEQGIQQLKSGLDKLGLDYIEPHGNFITLNCKQDTKSIYQALLGHGIIVRPLHPYNMADYLRVTCGTGEQNKRFLDTLELVL